MDRASRFGDLQEDENFYRLWTYVITSAPDFEVFNDHMPLEMPENWREFERNLATILDAVFRQFASAQGKCRWCEKSPNNSEHIQGIGHLFPGSKFVHIIRDGRDCAVSTKRRQHRNLELSIHRWRQGVSEAQHQGIELPDRYMEVRYEGLTNDPERWMRSICDFLSVEFDDRVLQSGMPQSGKLKSMPKGSVGRIEPNSKKFLQHLSAKQIDSLERIAGGKLAELGYKTYYATGNKDPGRLKSTIFRGIDFLRANHRLRDKLTGKRPITWRKILRGMLASIREFSSKRF
jgi:hypothetical protein